MIHFILIVPNLLQQQQQSVSNSLDTGSLVFPVPIVSAWTIRTLQQQRRRSYHDEQQQPTTNYFAQSHSHRYGATANRLFLSNRNKNDVGDDLEDNKEVEKQQQQQQQKNQSPNNNNNVSLSNNNKSSSSSTSRRTTNSNVPKNSSNNNKDNRTKPSSKKVNSSNSKSNNYKSEKRNSNSTKTTATSKQELVRAVGKSIQATRQQKQQQQQSSSSSNQFPLLNPYKAGQQLRQSIETTVTSILQQTTQTSPITTTGSDHTKNNNNQQRQREQSIYYIDDRFIERTTKPTINSSTGNHPSPKLPRSAAAAAESNDDTTVALRFWEEPDTAAFVPEILVVGATGRLGRLIVRQLLQLQPQPQSSLLSNSNNNNNVVDRSSSKRQQQQQQVPKVRVRVLVRDLYTRTLDILGTGVTYCQGDLSKIDTLEDAVTDIDKLVFVASSSSSPVPSVVGLEDDTDPTDDEDQHYHQHRIQMAEQIDCIGMSNLIAAYQNVRHADYGTSQAAKRSLFKFQDRQREDFNLFSIDDDDNGDTINTTTDYDDDDDNSENDGSKPLFQSSVPSSSFQEPTTTSRSSYNNNEYQNDNTDSYGNMMMDDDYVDTYGDIEEEVYDNMYGGEYDDDDDDDEYESYAVNDIEQRKDASVVKTQSQWIRNSFDHGVFVGRIPQQQQTSSSSSGEAAIISSRLRSRDDPEMGIELGPNFAGFICRICSDGNTYEAFVRTGSYSTHGIEYTCEFTTARKQQQQQQSLTQPTEEPSTTAANKGSTITNASRNKFLSVRLPFSSFKPVQRKTIMGNVNRGVEDDGTGMTIPPFRGYDVRHLGFRYRCDITSDGSTNSNSNMGRAIFGNNNKNSRVDRKTGIEWNRFYLAISYIKVYRSQPEPEFVYVSDGQIPPKVHDHMVRHDTKQIVPFSEGIKQSSNARSILQSGTKIQLLELDNTPLTTATKVTTHNNIDNVLKSKRRRLLEEETYYKHRGEELLKKSGLSYAIVRVNELCDSPARFDDMDDIVLSSTLMNDIDDIDNDETDNDMGTTRDGSVVTATPTITGTCAISRADVAQICVKALLDPNALNKSFYVYNRPTSTSSAAMTKVDISTKFASLSTDIVS